MKIPAFARMRKTYFTSSISINNVINSKLTMVIENPIQFTIVSAVPLNSVGALLATSVENNGESAITAIPQIRRYSKAKDEIDNSKYHGENRQQIPEINNAPAAVLFSPAFWEIIPPNAHEMLPAEIIIKALKEMNESACGCSLKWIAKRSGTKAQKL